MNKYAEILRYPHHIAFDITNRCNFRCLHCYNSSGENFICKHELTDDEVLRFVSEVIEYKPFSVCFCGGEPLLRKDLLCECLKMLKTQGIHTSFVTNGYYINKVLSEELDSIGVDGIQISLDGNESSHNQLRQNRDAYCKAIDAIDCVLNNTDIHLDIAFSPTSFNINHFVDAYQKISQIFRQSTRFTSNLVDTIELRVQPLMMYGRAGENNEIMPSEIQYEKLIYFINQLNSYRFENRVEIQWGDPLDHIFRFKNLERLMDQATIHADGSVMVSPYFPLIIGNIRRHNLSEYWKSGLNIIWSSPLVQSFCDELKTINNMKDISLMVGNINQGCDIEVDLIDGNNIHLLDNDIKGANYEKTRVF